MDVVQEIEDSRMVAIRVLDKDGCADVEEVGLCREVVDAFGGDQALAQLTQSHQDKREVLGLWRGGRKRRAGGRGGSR